MYARIYISCEVFPLYVTPVPSWLLLFFHLSSFRVFRSFFVFYPPFTATRVFDRNVRRLQAAARRVQYNVLNNNDSRFSRSVLGTLRKIDIRGRLSRANYYNYYYSLDLRRTIQLLRCPYGWPKNI